ncbi:MAG: chromosome partitioning protein ParB [Candidatus Niyogibacteria bacterium CG10_big_fil_rev_8_21_14_0_10_42_19]|uniref:Chromosome partitioning protein ParB n=1 Tax=Candidatus Niyogibacteria bacterium CG10_big_fil_rev_8_21_14_0_10_42_19 TaxID=1974725 RepID=A0A2H0TIJ1_9BACT|nr:MAG: chromosome partitioning protein ParB [Candidatus Niyogibacteria bacterium CG10_big_fil_rev_8_21_14_0_10_42_19]
MTFGENNQLRPAESVFWVEASKVKVNSQQPRREFDELKLKELSDSIRAYGVLQPLIVVRREVEVSTGTSVEYELIAGERRLRASRLAGLEQVPVIIRKEPSERVKLELALVENVQREDLNAIDRAHAFKKLINEFNMKQRDVAERIGKSREFVGNTIRILALPDVMQQALAEGKINEGHTRPLLMLSDRPEEQSRLFNDIIFKKMNVRSSEVAARRIAVERARKKEFDHETRSIEEKLSNIFGTRVSIEKKGEGGRISIDFFSPDELYGFFHKVSGDDDPGKGGAHLAGKDDMQEASFSESGADPMMERRENLISGGQNQESPDEIPGSIPENFEDRKFGQSPATDEDLRTFTI